MQIHWAVFGELNKGHALLSASGNPVLASRITLYSDRPGDPPAGMDWGPVVSGFPLGDHYVCLRTQPDTTAGRAGMVRSYAAFIPLADLSSVNNLAAIFSSLPSGLDRPAAKLAPLDISTHQLNEAPAIVQPPGLMQIAQQLCSTNVSLPLVWAFPESYVPAVAALWNRLPPGLRSVFAFSFQFAPEHKLPVPPTLIASLPDLASRWPNAQILSANQTNTDTLNSGQCWLAGMTDANAFNDVLRDYEIDLTQFSKLTLLSSFAELIGRLSKTSFAESKRALHVVAKHSKLTKTSLGKRTALFDRMCALVPQASAEDLTTLRNLDEQALPELVPPLQKAMTEWMVAAASTGQLSPDHISLLEHAAAAPTHWWGMPFVAWLRSTATRADALGASLLVELFASALLLEFIAKKLPDNEATETRLIQALPPKLGVATADHIIALAQEREWMVLHATCLMLSRPPVEAIILHSEIAGDHELGFLVLKKNLTFRNIAKAACQVGNSALVRFAGRMLAEGGDTALGELPESCPHHAQILQAALLACEVPPSGALRKAILAELESPTTTDASLIELCTTCVFRDVGLLLGLQSLHTLLDRLPANQKAATRTAISSFLLHEIAAQRPFQLRHALDIRDLIGPDEILKTLARVPVREAVPAGLNAFRCVSYLSDHDCRKWLVELFTRTQYQPIRVEAANNIATFLMASDFPESAKVVRETTEDFFRVDVAPIHEQIRYKYQMARAYERKATTPSVRLPKIVIATALKLERDEVIKHLSAASYDHALSADVAVWPATNPVFEVYVFISGAGNLAAQATMHRALSTNLKPAFAFFVGIGGGVKDSEIGDVVYGTKVYFYEGGKETAAGVLSRPADETTSETLVQLAHRVADKSWQPADSTGTGKPPKATPAVIASGELVFTSTAPQAEQFQRLKTDYNDTQVVDMEAYGFLKALRELDVKYRMVIRGVSDKLAGKSESDAKGNQPEAAKNAAAFVFAMLSECPAILKPKRKMPKKFLGFIDLGYKADED